MDIQETCSAALDAVLGTDDHARRDAERWIADAIANNLDGLVSAYLHTFVNDEMEHKRSVAAVLLRQVLFDENQQFFNVSESLRGEIRAGLFHAVEREEARRVQRSLCVLLAEVVSADETEEHAMELFNWIRTSADASNPPCARSGSMRVLEETIFLHVGGFLEEEEPVSEMAQIIASVISDKSAHWRIRMDAVRTGASLFLGLGDRESFVEGVRFLSPGMVEFVLDLRGEALFEGLSVLVDVCTNQVEALREVFEDLAVALCELVTQLDGAENRSRRMGLELVVSMAENAPTLARRSSKAFPELATSACVVLGCEPDEDRGWETREESDESDPVDNVSMCMTGIERLGAALEGNRVGGLVLPDGGLRFLEGRKEEEVELSCAAVLSGMSGGVEEDMTEEELEPVARRLAELCRSKEPLTRHAAASAIAKWSAVHCPTFQRVAAGFLSETMVRLMRDDSARVRAQGCAALAAFAGMCPSDLFDGGVAELLQEPLRVVHTGTTKTEREWALQAVSSVVSSAGEYVSEEYDELMGVLRPVVRDPGQTLGLEGVDEDDLRLLAGKALEALAILASAVDRQRFMRDADAVVDDVQFAASILRPAAESDPLRSSVFDALSRLANVLRHDFKPLLLPTITLLADSAAAAVVAEELTSQQVLEFQAAVAEGMVDPDQTLTETEDSYFRVRENFLQGDKV